MNRQKIFQITSLINRLKRLPRVSQTQPAKSIVLQVQVMQTPQKKLKLEQPNQDMIFQEVTNQKPM
jgi:hypothetical protein